MRTHQRGSGSPLTMINCPVGPRSGDLLQTTIAHAVQLLSEQHKSLGRFILFFSVKAFNLLQLLIQELEKFLLACVDILVGFEWYIRILHDCRGTKRQDFLQLDSGAFSDRGNVRFLRLKYSLKIP